MISRLIFSGGFSLFLEQLTGGTESFPFEETPQFETVGPMFDLSRYGIFKVDKFKEMLRILAMMGFDSAMLYMEDTYEVKDYHLLVICVGGTLKQS